MIGRWAKAGAAAVLGLAVVADVGLATAMLDHAGDDLPAAWQFLSALAGPASRPALAGREAVIGGAVAGAAAGGAALVLGSSAAALSGITRAVLVALLRLPGVCAVVFGVLAAIAVLEVSGPVAAALVGFAVATRPLGAPWTLAIVLVPLAMAMVEPAARRLDRAGFESLATFGFGPVRRLLGTALPAVLPAAIRAAVIVFVIATVCLFAAAWPVAARQTEVVTLAATVPVRPLAALAFCIAGLVAVVGALVGERPD